MGATIWDQNTLPSVPSKFRKTTVFALSLMGNDDSVSRRKRLEGFRRFVQHFGFMDIRHADAVQLQLNHAVNGFPETAVHPDEAFFADIKTFGLRFVSQQKKPERK